VAEGVATGLGPDAEAVGLGADGDGVKEGAVSGGDDVDGGVVAAGEPGVGVPSAVRLPMSGLALPGRCHLVISAPVWALRTLMVPSWRLVT
jgi:hypothetical protein